MLIALADQRLWIFSGALVCHPDQMSEAQAEAKAWRDQREAMWLKMRGKKIGFTREKMRAALLRNC